MSGIDSNTKLILQGNLYGESSVPDGSLEIIDSGNTGHIITQVGTAQLSTTQKKFGSCSLLLDGNSDYLTIPDSNDWNICANTTDNWTWAMWVRLDTISSDQYFIAQSDDSTHEMIFWHSLTNGLVFQVEDGSKIIYVAQGEVTISADTWTHIALVKVADEYGLYINGTQVAYTQDTSTKTYSASLYIGSVRAVAFFDGYMDDVLIQNSNVFSASPNSGKTDTFTVPTEAYTSDSNTKLLLHFESQDNSAQAGNTPKILTFNGDAQIDTAQYKFGSGSYLFDGTGDYISISDSDDWWPSTGDYTVDCWFKTSMTASGMLVGQSDSSGNGTSFSWYLRVNDTANKINVRIRKSSTAVSITSTTNVNDGNWHHVAFVVYSGMAYLYVDGTSEGTPLTLGGAINNSAYPLSIGRIGDLNSHYFNGWIDELRVSKGIARWTSNFTPPTEAYTYIDESYIPNQCIIIM